MADIEECIGKLVAAGQISKAIGNEALQMFQRSRAEYSLARGPAGADAAAALQAAKEMQQKSAERLTEIANQVKTWRTIERRVVDDPRGGLMAIQAMDAKDTLRGDNRLNKLRREQPDHPIFRAGNVDSKTEYYTRQLYAMLGPEVARYRAGALTSQQAMYSARNLVREVLGEDTGDPTAQAVAKGMASLEKFARDAALARGKIFEPNEDWRFYQRLWPRRLDKFSEQEFARDVRESIDSGGIKLWDKEKNAPATADREDYIIKKAYADIKYERGGNGPFSAATRTFRYQSGKPAADAWLKMQAKYGVGNEIMEALDQHVRGVARELATLDVWGPKPQAAFEAALRLAKEKNPTRGVGGVLRPLDSELVTRMTHSEATGAGEPVVNEGFASFMAGLRSVVGAAALRNLSIAIAPGDAAMTLLSAQHDGISGLGVLKDLFTGMGKDIARDLQITAHSWADWSQHAWRRYDDQLNVAGFARWLPRTIVRATGANLWSTNLRASYEAGIFKWLARERGNAWEQLHPALRDNFLAQYGFTPAEWDTIRGLDPLFTRETPIVDLPTLSKEHPELSQRLQTAAYERSTYAAHQPDARTRGIAKGSTIAGTPGGEVWRSMAQFKQFALERMTTHVMRALYEGTPMDRIRYGAMFVILSTLAGAISRQAETVATGQNLHDMTDPRFWTESFAYGGAGGIYGDLIDNALRGNTTAMGGAALGPLGGLGTDVVTAIGAAARNRLGGPRTSVNEVFGAAKRWTPNTWYSKLVVDRIIWEQLQTLLDPNYRQSFRRATQAANRQGREGFWWAPGELAPQSAPQLGR